MRILLLSDLHLRTSRPRGRCDDFFQTEMGKLEQIMDIHDKQDCEFILQAGDLFDSPDPSNFLMSRVISMMRGYGGCFYTVYGQHDLTMHSVETAQRSATQVLWSAGVAHILKPDGELLVTDAKLATFVYGSSFGDSIPKPKEPEAKNILVAHISVGTRPLFPGHRLIQPELFLNSHPGYKLILVGDYHYPFHVELDGRHIVNVGCMLRLRNTPDDRAHHPQVGVYDTEANTVEFFPLTIKPAEEVFRDDNIVLEPANERVMAFVHALQAGTQAGASFKENLDRHCQEQNIGEEGKDRIARSAETVGLDLGERS